MSAVVSFFEESFNKSAEYETGEDRRRWLPETKENRPAHSPNHRPLSPEISSRRQPGSRMDREAPGNRTRARITKRSVSSYVLIMKSLLMNYT